MPRSREEYLREERLKTDATKRLPICFCLDTSGSMRARIAGKGEYTGEIIEIDGRKRRAVKGGITALSELQKGMVFFLDQIKKDDIARSSAEISVITFDDEARTLIDFCSIDDFPYEEIDRIQTHDNTFMGEGIELSLNKLEACIEENKRYGIDNYAPLLIIMSDGYPSDDEYMMQMIRERIALSVKNDNLMVIPIGIGNQADLRGLSNLAEGCNATKIYGVEFEKLFDQLTEYVEDVARLFDDSRVEPHIDLTERYQRNDDEGVHDTFELATTEEYVIPIMLAD